MIGDGPGLTGNGDVENERCDPADKHARRQQNGDDLINNVTPCKENATPLKIQIILRPKKELSFTKS